MSNFEEYGDFKIRRGPLLIVSLPKAIIIAFANSIYPDETAQ